MRLLKFRLVPTGASVSSQSILLFLLIVNFYIISIVSASKNSTSVTVSSSSKGKKSHSHSSSTKSKSYNPIDEAKIRESKRHSSKKFHPINVNETVHSISSSSSGTKPKSSRKIDKTYPVPTVNSWTAPNGDVWTTSITNTIIATPEEKPKAKNVNSTANNKDKSKSKPKSHTVKKDFSKPKINIKPTDITHFTYSDIRPNAGFNSPATQNNVTALSSQSEIPFVSMYKSPVTKVSSSSSSSSSSSVSSSSPNNAQILPFTNQDSHYNKSDYNHEILKLDYSNNLASPSTPFRNDIIYPPPAPYPDPYAPQYPIPVPIPVPPRVPLHPFATSPYHDFKWPSFEFGGPFPFHEGSARGVSSGFGASGIRHKGSNFGSRPFVQSPAVIPIIDSGEKLGSASGSYETYSNIKPTTANFNKNNNGNDDQTSGSGSSVKYSSQVPSAHPSTKIASQMSQSHEKTHSSKGKQKHKPKDKDNESRSSHETVYGHSVKLPKHAYVATAGLSPGVDPGLFFASSVTHYQTEPPNEPLQLKKKSNPEALVPLDKRIVYICMVFSWIFWLITFTTYYHWGERFGHPVPGKPGYYYNHPVVFTVPNDGSKPYFNRKKRSIEGNLPGGKWNFTRVLEMIDIAQKTYEGFDWQSLDCQKKVLCELSHKNSDLGETGRKISTSINYYTGATDRFIDVLEGLPIPQVLHFYLKEYKSAIAEGKKANKECAQIYPQCKFSLKQIFMNKAVKKAA